MYGSCNFPSFDVYLEFVENFFLQPISSSFTNDQANGIDITGVDASVTSISFCSKTSCLAVGSESGMVRIPVSVDNFLIPAFSLHLIFSHFSGSVGSPIQADRP